MKVLLTLALTIISFMLMLWRQALDIYSHNPQLDGGYWAAFVEIFSSTFNKPEVQLLLLFMILAPSWAVFASRKLKKLSLLMLSFVTIWLFSNVLFAMNYLSYSDMIGWFVYSALMLLTGLLIMLYRIFNKNVEYELREMKVDIDDEPSYQKNKTWY